MSALRLAPVALMALAVATACIAVDDTAPANSVETTATREPYRTSTPTATPVETPPLVLGTASVVVPFYRGGPLVPGSLVISSYRYAVLGTALSGESGSVTLSVASGGELTVVSGVAGGTVTANVGTCSATGMVSGTAATISLLVPAHCRELDGSFQVFVRSNETPAMAVSTLAAATTAATLALVPAERSALHVEGSASSAWGGGNHYNWFDSLLGSQRIDWDFFHPDPVTIAAGEMIDGTTWERVRPATLTRLHSALSGGGYYRVVQRKFAPGTTEFDLTSGWGLVPDPPQNLAYDPETNEISWEGTTEAE